MSTRSGELVTISKAKFFGKILSVFRSLRFRVFVLVIAAGIIPALILRAGMIGSYESRAISLRTADVSSQCNLLAGLLRNNNYIADPSSEIVNAQLNQLADIYTGRVMVVDSSMKVIQDTFSLDAGKTIVSSEVVRCLKGRSDSKYNKDEGYIEITVPVYNEDNTAITGVLLASVSTDSISNTIEIIRSKADVIVIAIIAAILILAFTSSFIIVRPIRRLEGAVEGYADGYADHIDGTHGYTETKPMIDDMNKAIAVMRTIDDSRQEFVSNVSHELKTPITSMKVLADSLLSQEDVPVELYHEFMTDIAEEVDRENHIINDLLNLVRLDKKAAMDLKSVNINDLLEQIMKRLRPIAAVRDIELVLESFRPVIAEVDETKLSLAFTNLMENAIKYNKDAGWVHVSLNADHKYFYVKVSDSGIGIPEEDMEHIFDRFYRVDKSHSTEISGTGLGLAITRSAVVLHRGAIKVYSKLQEGTTFTVRIPLTYIV